MWIIPHAVVAAHQTPLIEMVCTRFLLVEDLHPGDEPLTRERVHRFVSLQTQLLKLTNRACANISSGTRDEACSWGCNGVDARRRGWSCG